ncbi:MAG: hypothetical protein GY713_04940 [Actinomycetia bacterium]|nr:hypothetical protein [Actinomycetes bacterium]
MFAESVTRSWIDQPALARQAELAGHNVHRPGSLPDHELRTLLDQKADITGTLIQLDDDLDRLTRTYQHTRHEHQEALKGLAADRERYEKAHEYLDRRDRPLRRRGHETSITNAHHTVPLNTSVDDSFKVSSCHDLPYAGSRA